VVEEPDQQQARATRAVIAAIRLPWTMRRETRSPRPGFSSKARFTLRRADSQVCRTASAGRFCFHANGEVRARCKFGLVQPVELAGPTATSLVRSVASAVRSVHWGRLRGAAGPAEGGLRAHPGAWGLASSRARRNRMTLTGRPGSDWPGVGHGRGEGVSSARSFNVSPSRSARCVGIGSRPPIIAFTTSRGRTATHSSTKRGPGR
jgi:hypothetical protein